MREIYTTLYQGVAYGSIPAEDYLGRLIENLGQSFGRAGVRFETDIEQISVPVRQAFPLGIIVNELVTNALKYAFPTHDRGVVRVRLRTATDGELLVQVEDDGVGIGAVDGTVTYGFGLRLVETLATRYDGRFSITGTHGTTAEVTLKQTEN
jgi:two-component sensor histidine kinase